MKKACQVGQTVGLGLIASLLLMTTEIYNAIPASLKLPRLWLFVHTGVAVHFPPAAKEVTTFDSTMSDKDFLKWLRSKGMSQKDSKALLGNF